MIFDAVAIVSDSPRSESPRIYVYPGRKNENSAVISYREYARVIDHSRWRLTAIRKPGRIYHMILQVKNDAVLHEVVQDHRTCMTLKNGIRIDYLHSGSIRITHNGVDISEHCQLRNTKK